MKIRLVIIDSDEQYLKRIVAAFHNQYADKLEIYSFTTDEAAYNNLKQLRVDVIAAAEQFRIDADQIPKRCGFLYLTENAAVDVIEEQQAICKYQKIDFIYKAILGLYAENAGAASAVYGNGTIPVISFFSVNGGAGSSTLAAATALQMARAGKRTLYLNMEQTGSSSLYFQAPGEGSFSDIIYMLKSKHVNIALKLQSIVKQTAEGIYFFDDCTQAMDILELTDGEFEKLIGVLQSTEMFDRIIIDLGSSVTAIMLRAFGISSKVICVSDGSETCQIKFKKLIEILEVQERQKDISLIPRLAIIYNKFSNKSGIAVDMGKYSVLGGMPRYEGINTRQIVEKLSGIVLLEQ